MTVHWSWGLSTALILALVIWLNGRQVRAGWLLGAGVQVINMGFGLAYRQWTFVFLAIPAVMFLFNWWRHPRRVHRQLTPVRCSSRYMRLQCVQTPGHNGPHLAFRPDLDQPGQVVVEEWETEKADRPAPAWPLL